MANKQALAARQPRWLLLAALLLAVLLSAAPAWAAPGVDQAIARLQEDGQPLSTSLQIILLMSVLTILPSILLMMTSFTRIIIVLSILRQALGLQQTPPNQVLVGLALFLSMFIMRPVFDDINRTAYTPYVEGRATAGQAVEQSTRALHRFMMAQTREQDLAMFSEMADAGKFETPADVPLTILLPAFVTSELKTAFIIGFLIYLPFLVIDLVVATTMTAMGMVMLSPSIISLPFKLLLFVMVDGWALTMGSLAQSFAGGG